jgi:hypothetical protein
VIIMATGIGQQLKGMVRKARNYWAELTDEESTRTQHRQEEQEDAVHQRYGGVRTQGERAIDKGLHSSQENPPDRGPSDTILASEAARAGRGMSSGPRGSEPTGSQQMQGSQTQRQYTQQGGSGIQKTIGEQVGGQTGAQGTGSDPDTVRSSQSRPPAGGQQSH